MDIRVWIDSITFNDGTTIQMEKDQVLILVGPNNAGKSTSLKDLNLFLKYGNGANQIIQNSTLKKEGDDNDLLEYMSNAFESKVNDGRTTFFLDSEKRINNDDLRSIWNSKPFKLNALADFFTEHMDTRSRLNILSEEQRKNFKIEIPSNLIQKMYIDNNIESLISSYFNKAFGIGVFIHQLKSSDLRLYIGKKVPLDPNKKKEYNNKMKTQTMLGRQGDGMLSFAGLILRTFIPYQQILLIDEPEAFLHPPQARIVGRMLIQQKPENRQYIIATHSIDIIKGMFDTGTQNLKIVRISRNFMGNKEVNIPKILDTKDIEVIRQDPYMRFSNILNCMFYEKVILCEGDSDCRFYSAILQSICEQEKRPMPDYLFVSCGGKGKIHKIIKKIRNLEIPINVIVDFDSLNDNTIKDIYEAQQGRWRQIQKQYRVIIDYIHKEFKPTTTTMLKLDIDNILNCNENEFVKTSDRNAISELLSATKRWSKPKKYGVKYFKDQIVRKSFQELKSELQKQGILIVETGELESLVPRIKKKKKDKWIQAVFDLPNFNETRSLSRARRFVKQLLP